MNDYKVYPVEKELSPQVIGPAPDEKELTPVYLPAPREKELALPSDWASP